MDLELRETVRARVKYNHRKPDYHVTELSNLYNSQYVGPVGVGTVKMPSNCALPKDGNVIFISGLDVQATREERASCHLEEESQIWVVFDTGSTNVWLSSDLCSTPPCTNQGRHRYSHMKSVTFLEPRVPIHLDITFGTGELKGPQGIDDIHVGPFTVKQQTFGMVEREIGNVFTEVPFEGIVGLAFPAMSANGVKPFFDNVVDQKVMAKNEFAFYFNSDDKAGNGIFWGGVDPNFYEGEIRMFPVSQPYYWSIDLHKFKIGEKELKVGTAADQFMQSPLNPLSGVADTLDLNRKPKLIVDSGTTYFTAESGLYQQIMSMLKSAPCDAVTDTTHPPLTYELKDMDDKIQSFVIPSEEYMVSDEEGRMCEPAFMKIDIPKKYGPGMLLGEVFMRNYFTVFDRGDGDVNKARIGFARSKKGPQVSESLMKMTGGLHSFKQGHKDMPSMMQSIMQKAESATATRFHHKPGLSEGSSQLQKKEKKKFRVNPWMKAK